MAKYEEWTTEDGLTMLEGWARRGLTDKEIAHNVGVSERQFTRWKKEHPSILSALKKGKEITDLIVEGALYKRACGYEYEEKMTEVIEQPDGSQRKYIKKTLKTVPPDVTAQIFWLKNRRPDLWRDKQEVTVDETALQKIGDVLDGIEVVANETE